MNRQFLIMLAFIGSTIFAEESLHGEDHHHEEHEDAFVHLLEVTGSSNTEKVLDSNAFTNLLETLKGRMHCDHGSMCYNCLSETIINAALNKSQEEIGIGFTEESFFDTARYILEHLAHKNCSEDSNLNHYNISSGQICRYELEDLLEKIAAKYEENEASTECFNHYTILSENCTEHTEDVFYEILANLYTGHCILPTILDFENQLFQHVEAINGIITNQAYESLLVDLGIGALSSTDNITSTHDDHNHARKRREIDEDEHDHDHDDHADDHESTEDHQHHLRCYSGAQLKSIFGFYNNLTQEQLLQMCPAFLQQIAEGSCSQTRSNEAENNQTDTYTTAQKYGYGTASVAIISSLAFVGILFFPVLKTTKFQLVMQFFVALGVGTMSGDALLHIIPEITGIHGHDPSEPHDDHEEEDKTYIWKLLVVIAGMWMLFLFENGLKVFSNRKTHSHSHGHHNHAYHQSEAPSQARHVTEFTKEVCDSSECGQADEISKSNDVYVNISDETRNNGKKTVEDEPKVGEKRNEDPPTYFLGITAVGMMIFVGDALHNFGDGIAIGAAFSVSWLQGIGTSLAIVFHELPHEFGDFAIYLNNGLSKWKALGLNFAAACCCFVGLYIGIAVSEDTEVRLWLLSAVAGMFLYVSLVNVMHEMLAEESIYPKLQFFIQNVGLLLGWAILLLIAIYEEDLISSIEG